MSVFTFVKFARMIIVFEKKNQRMNKIPYAGIIFESHVRVQRLFLESGYYYAVACLGFGDKGASLRKERYRSKVDFLRLSEAVQTHFCCKKSKKLNKDFIGIKIK